MESLKNESTHIIKESFSFYKAPIINILPYKSISIRDVYNYIVGNYAKLQTEVLRQCSGPALARTYKSQSFDYCTFSGVFERRYNKGLLRHSGLLCIDIDHIENVEALFEKLLADEYFETKLLFRSPSGDGLKWIIPVDFEGVILYENIHLAHSEYFSAVANYILETYNVEVDKSGKDVARACFLPHDPKAYILPSYIEPYE